MNATTRQAHLIEMFTLASQEHGTTPREEAYSLYSDMHKDEYGVRARFAADFSLAELVSSIISLETCYAHRMQMEKEVKERFERIKKEVFTPRPFILGDFWPA